MITHKKKMKPDRDLVEIEPQNKQMVCNFDRYH